MLAGAGGLEAELFVDLEIAGLDADASGDRPGAVRVRQRRDASVGAPIRNGSSSSLRTTVSSSGLSGRTGCGSRGRSSSTTANAAIPSPRPVKPSCSLVVALTLTSPIGHARSVERLRRIASMCGARRGFSHTTVTSALASA